MNTLRDIQNSFQDYLLQDSKSIYQHIFALENICTETRLAIYGNGYRWRLYDALIDSYPALQAVLDEDAFMQLLALYVKQCPSEYKSLRWFGHEIATILQQHESYRDFPYLAELAELEWTVGLAFDAPDSHVFQLADMAAIPPDVWGSMTLKLNPSLYFLNFAWNVVEVWQAIANEEAAPSFARNESTSTLVVWRKDYQIQFTPLAPEEAWALTAVANGATFADICMGLCEWVDETEVGMYAASLLKGWIDAALVATIEYSSS